MGYCCYYNQEDATDKTAVLTFKRAELLYDAGNYAYVEGDTMDEDAQHSRHQVQDIAQEGNVNRATRVLNLAHAECVEALYPYSKAEIPDGQEPLDDVLAEPETYEITLALPPCFSVTTVRLLEHLVHEYLVCRVVADWLSITRPEREAAWEKKYTELRGKMQTALVSRRGKVRRPMKPF